MNIPRRKPYFSPKIISKLIRFSLSNDKGLIINKLEKNLVSELGIPNPVLVESGRIGLYLILKYSGLKKGSEIIIPGLTFGTLKSVIKLSGYKPIPVDSDAETFQMSPNAVRNGITPKTGAILATHMFGNPCDIKSLKKIAENNKLLLIEDCAESLGATLKGKQTGTFGDIAFSSFNIAKPLQGIGGGVVFGHNKEIISRIRLGLKRSKTTLNLPIGEIARSLCGYYLSQTKLWSVLMYLFSFPKIQHLFVLLYRHNENIDMGVRGISCYFAFIVNENLKTFRKRLAKTQIISNYYRRRLSPFIFFQKQPTDSTGNGYMVTALYKSDVLKLRRHLAKKSIDVAVKAEVADDCLNKTGSTTSELFEHLVAIPIYYSMTKIELNKVCQNIRAVIKVG